MQLEVKSHTQSTLQFFEGLLYVKGWGIYVIVLNKDHYKAKIYVSSATSAEWELKTCTTLCS